MATFRSSTSDLEIQMDKEFIMIETDLQKLSPKKISDSLLDRLDAAMCSWDHSVLIADADPEIELLELVPLVAPYDMIERLDTAMSRWHESVPVEEKVISWEEEVPPKERVFQWRKVVAVSLIGASAALYATQERKPSVQASHKIPVHQAGVSLATFQPQDATSRVLDYKEGGVISDGKGQMLRCVAVKVANEISFQNAKGETVTVEKPQYKVIFVPVNVD
jgi:hypothetical protein